jgi:signal peptidase I
MKKVIVIIFVVIVALVVWIYWAGIFPVQVYKNVGHSMEPTIQDGGYVGLNKADTNYQRSDLVVAKDPIENKEVIKRIIGVPNDTLELKDGKVLINNSSMEEKYIIGNTFPHSAATKFVLGSNDFFIMGDNRMVSKDSRDYGPIGRDRILGKAVLKK